MKAFDKLQDELDHGGGLACARRAEDNVRHLALLAEEDGPNGRRLFIVRRDIGIHETHLATDALAVRVGDANGGGGLGEEMRRRREEDGVT